MSHANNNAGMKALTMEYAEQRKVKRSFRSRLQRRTEEVLREMNRSGAKSIRDIVDLGTADARMLDAVSQVYPLAHCVGVEYSHDLVEYAQKQYPHLEIIQGNVQFLNFPDNSFDVAIAAAVLEHAIDPFAMLAEAARILRPGGLLIITSPHPFWEFLARKCALLDDEQHCLVMRIKEIEHMMRQAGFAVIHSARFMLVGFGLPGEAFLEKACRKLRLNFLFINQLIVGTKYDY